MSCISGSAKWTCGAVVRMCRTLDRFTTVKPHPKLKRRLRAVAVISALIFPWSYQAAHAEVSIEGPPNAVHVEARDAGVTEILEALGAKFKLQYRTTDILDRRMTGSFNGPLWHVVARILDGYDFALTVMPDGIDALVMRQSGTGPVPAPVTVHAAPAKSPARVMTAQEANRYERANFP